MKGNIYLKEGVRIRTTSNQRNCLEVVLHLLSAVISFRLSQTRSLGTCHYSISSLNDVMTSSLSALSLAIIMWNNTFPYSQHIYYTLNFASHSDSLVAKLQLLNGVSCRTMDLFFSVITDPGFDINLLTLRSSTDIVNFAEEARIRDQMAVVHRRSINSEGAIEQAGLLHTLLEDVLDIIEKEKVARIKSRFEETLTEEDMHEDRGYFIIEEDRTLSNMSLVHRSWTLPAQKALNRSVYLGWPLRYMNCFLRSYIRAMDNPRRRGSILPCHLQE